MLAKSDEKSNENSLSNYPKLSDAVCKLEDHVGCFCYSAVCRLLSRHRGLITDTIDGNGQFHLCKFGRPHKCRFEESLDGKRSNPVGVMIFSSHSDFTIADKCFFITFALHFPQFDLRKPELSVGTTSSVEY